MSQVYLYFARDYLDHLTFTDDMLVELYTYESTGKGSLSESNGYAMGKRNIDIAVAAWTDDLNNGMLFLHELYEDENLPHWFLDKVLSQFQHRPKTFEAWQSRLKELLNEAKIIDKHEPSIVSDITIQ